MAVTGRQPTEDEQVVACEHCGRYLAGSAAVFRLNGRDRFRRVCRTCAFTNAAVLRRSLRIAVIIGSVLLVINQGDVLAAGLWRAGARLEDPADVPRPVHRRHLECADQQPHPLTAHRRG
jgi:hypothetical protein